MQLNKQETDAGFVDLFMKDILLAYDLIKELQLPTDAIDYIKIGVKILVDKPATTQEWFDVGMFYENTITKKKDRSCG